VKLKGITALLFDYVTRLILSYFFMRKSAADHKILMKLIFFKKIMLLHAEGKSAGPARISSDFSLAQGALIGRALFASQLDPGQRLRRINSWQAYLRTQK